MFENRGACLDRAFQNSGVDTNALRRVFGPGDLEHNGTLGIVGDMQALDSGWAPYSGTSAHLNPMPAVKGTARIVGTDGPDAGDNGEEGATLSLNNIPGGDAFPMANLHGDGGFAIRIINGVLWNQGESWLGKWAKIQSVGTLTDTKSYSLPAGSETTYYYADCLICGDSKGRGVTQEPLRIFSEEKFSRAAVGGRLFYLRDQDGVAWNIGKGPATTPYVKATADWVWESGYTGTVGSAMFQECSNIFGDTADSDQTTFKVYLRATAAEDPNIHINDVLQYHEDASGIYVASGGYLDAKINTIEEWGGTTADIKAGWIEHTSRRGRFPVGYNPANADYNSVGKTGGSHPVTVPAHTVSEINAHEFTTSSNETGVSVDSKVTGISVATHSAKDTSASVTGINDHTDDAVAAAIKDHPAADIALALVNHGPEAHVKNLTNDFVNASSDGRGYDDHPEPGHNGSGVDVTHAAKTGNNNLTHTGSHTHKVSAYTHSVTDGGHTHAISDSGHDHTANLAHSGSLLHKPTDMRPFFEVGLFIKRVYSADE